MPEVATPPAAPAAPPTKTVIPFPKPSTPAPSAAPKADAPKPAAPSSPPTSADVPKKQSPWDRISGDLDKLAGKEGQTIPPNQTLKPSAETPKDATPEPTDDDAPEPVKAEADKDQLKPDATELEKQIAEERRDRKVKAWPLVDKYRNICLKQEKEILELKSKPVTESPDIKPLNERLQKTTGELEATRKQLQEAHEELKYAAYEKSPEFKEQHIKPLEDAWAKALYDLKGLKVSLSDGTAREIAWQDIQALAQMEPDVRRATIKEQFPEDIQEVTGHVKAIRDLVTKQKDALEQFRKGGDERTKQKTEAQQTQIRAMTDEVVKAWTEANAQAPKHEKYGRFFAPVEGDDEGNALLAAGYEKADKAFSANPLDPNLTPEQRADIVKRQAAQRNRSAAFSRNVRMIERLEAEVSELKAKLEEYANTEPGNGNGRPAAVPTVVKPMDRLMSGLEKYAR